MFRLSDELASRLSFIRIVSLVDFLSNQMGSVVWWVVVDLVLFMDATGVGCLSSLPGSSPRSCWGDRL
jgi:hypothetical protein